MSKPTSPPPAPDVSTLLNQAVLRFGPDLSSTKLQSDRIVLKYQPGRRYLVLTPAQVQLLQEFGHGKTVTHVLCEAIGAQRNPSLRELYELVVKAVRVGVLQTAAHPLPPPVAPMVWRWTIPGGVMKWLAGISFVAAAVSAVLRPVPMPLHPGWLLLGWVAACAAVSLGWVLAAGVVRHAGCEVYQPRFDWRPLGPCFAVDLEDALMGGRGAMAHAALARLVPFFAFITAAAWTEPGLLLPLFAGALVQLSPLWKSPLHDLLAALYRDPQLATAYDLVFARDRLFTLLVRARQQIGDHRYLLVCAGATVGWLLLAFLSGCLLLQANAVVLLKRFQAAGGWRYTALVLLGCIAVLLAGVVGTLGWIVVSHVRSWWRERQDRKLRPKAVLVSTTTIAEWLGRTVLFRDLPAPELGALADAVKPEEHRRGSFVVKEGELGTQLFVVLSGRLEIRRDYAPGRSEPVAEMGEGDVFGEIALLQGGVRTRSVRCLTRSTLLALDKAEFERLVLSKLSRQAVEDAVQKVGFLQHTMLTRHWSNEMMSAFARRAKLIEMPEATVILQEGAPNHWFYLVHRGELVVKQKDRELRRLKQGDSFGELSLMGDGLVTASVVVRSKMASCLAINGRDFLDFITKDFTIGLQWEQSKTRRIELPEIKD